ncbi:MAG: hypothetical protein KKA64_00615 [Nanoarchaeota archaeon]|nr:hypothetical protein [Nanoarchaeota archaeon]
MKKIERLIDKLNISQREGIFQVPEEVSEDKGVQGWLKRLSNFEQTPLVVKEETYYQVGIEKKLNTSRRIITEKLSKYGLIRPQGSEDFDYIACAVSEPVSNLSLTQVISYAFNQPIESILVSEDLFSSKEFLEKSPSERVKILFNAYKGSCWFEHFRKKQEQIAKAIKNPPKIMKNQRISRADLGDYFISRMDSSNKTTLGKLCDKGFIIPANGSFKSKSLNNLVDNEGLAQLLSLLYSIDKSEILIKDDNYTEELVSSFVSKRLLPYLAKTGIDEKARYTVSQSSHLTGISYRRIYQAVQKGTINNVSKNSDIKIRGDELVIYALGNRDKLVFREEDVMNLFGVENTRLGRKYLKPTNHRTYSKHHYVFPLYDEVAKKAKILMLDKSREKDNSIKLSAFNREIYLPERIQSEYCEVYGLDKWDNYCYEHIREQIHNGRCLGNKIETDDLIFKLDGEMIRSVRMRE